MKKTIAIIEDDEHIGNIIEKNLWREGYEVVRAYSGTEANYLLEKQKIDLILLDLMLPGLSGEELLAQIKDIPVIVVSAKVGVDDKVSLLLSGAVDYVTKPFDMKELLARIQVHLRKDEGLRKVDMYEFGELRFDEKAQEVYAGENLVRLTKTERAIMKQLLKQEGQVLAKSALLDAISFDTPDCTESSLKQHISNLRRKLKEAGGKDYIESVWGIGFKLVC
ncbi:MAG: response regulator transcription factor [Lachnospira sp.]|nr:response regulator transcription factor [Lachnospira sp.]